VRAEQSGEHAQERGLAGAVRAEDGQSGRVIEPQRDSAQRRALSEVALQALEGDSRWPSLAGLGRRLALSLRYAALAQGAPVAAAPAER
jgi:hypothetical protein